MVLTIIDPQSGRKSHFDYAADVVVPWPPWTRATAPSSLTPFSFRWRIPMRTGGYVNGKAQVCEYR